MKQHVLNQESGFTQLLVNTFKNQMTTAISLPNELSSFLKNANDTDIEEEIIGVKKMLQKLYFLGQQFFYVFLLMGLGYFLLHYDFANNSMGRKLNWVLILICGLLFVRSFFKDMRV